MISSHSSSEERLTRSLWRLIFWRESMVVLGRVEGTKGFPTPISGKRGDAISLSTTPKPSKSRASFLTEDLIR